MTQDTPDPKAPPITEDANKGTIPAAEVEDRSQYIRTMAKDMASITGNEQAPAKAAVQTPAPAQSETVSGVSMPSVDAYSEQQQLRKDERDAQETVALPSVEEAGEIVAAKPMAAPAAMPVLPAEDVERAAILDRLRKKVGESGDMTIQSSPAPLTPLAPIITPPQPVIPPSAPPIAAPAPAPLWPAPAPRNEWPDIPQSTPAFQPLSEAGPVERMPQVSRPAPVPAPSPVAGLHTYTSDFADHIDTKSASTFSVLAAESDARARKAPRQLAQKRDYTRPLIVVGSGILLLVLAGGGIFATYQFVMNKNSAPVVPLSVPSIVFADEHKELNGEGAALMNALALAADEPLIAGNVLVTYVTEPIAGENGIEVLKPAHGINLIRALGLPAPDILLRNLAIESTVGVVHAGEETRPFFALRVDSYERTYAGMLTWEPLMERDLRPLYPLYPAPVAQPVSIDPETVATTTATTTATSTLPAATSTPVQAPIEELPIQAPALTRFVDAVVANHDVRVLRDTRGLSLVLYGYADKETLIIARDEAAFELLLGRLQKDD